MSFQSDLIGVLKAEIGPSASLFYKKCMLQLKKNPASITPADIEEIADWAYDEIRSMIDEKTAFRVRHQIIQIPPTVDVLKRPFSPHPVPKRLDDSALIDTIKLPETLQQPAPAAAAAKAVDTVQERDFSGLVSKSLTDLQKKNSLAPVPAPAVAAPVKAEDTLQERDFSGLISKSLTDPEKKKSVAAAPPSTSVPPRAADYRKEHDFSGLVSKSLTDLEKKKGVAAVPVPVPVPAKSEDTLPEHDFSSVMSKTSPDLQKKKSEAAAPVPVPVPAKSEDTLPEHDFSSVVGKSSPDLPKKKSVASPPAQDGSVDFFISDSKQQPEPFKGSVQDLMEDAGPEPEEAVTIDHNEVKPVTLANHLEDCLSRIETDNENAGLWAELADLYLRSGKFREAVQAYQRVIGLGVETPAIWNSLGDSYKKTGQYEDSDEAYARSLELDANNPAIWLKRAKVLASRNKYDDALASCDQSLTLDDTSGAAWNYKAFILKKVGRNEDALEIYSYLHHLDPKDENATRQVIAIQKLLKK
jgi:hypothetical protein